MKRVFEAPEDLLKLQTDFGDIKLTFISAKIIREILLIISIIWPRSGLIAGFY